MNWTHIRVRALWFFAGVVVGGLVHAAFAVGIV